MFVGNTRTELRLRPSMEHEISERTRFGANLSYSNVNYEEQALTSRQDYNDFNLETLVKYLVRPQTEFWVGPYISRYEASEDANRTDSAGVTFGWRHDVSEIYHLEITTAVERTKVEDPSLLSNTQTETNWGAEVSGYRMGRASRLDYGVGRYLAPSGIGSKVQRDELRLQYTRQWTSRFDYRGALRGGNEQRLGLDDGTRDRSYIRGEFFVRWFMTQTMYISGGYRYSWQKYKAFPDDADDNAALLLFGFRGLDVRRSAVRGAQ